MMPTYRYESKNSAGKVTHRRAHRRRTWRRRRSSCAPAASTSSPSRPADGRRPRRAAFNLELSFGPGAKDVQNFTSQLAVMIRAGISIRAAIEGIADQVENPKFKAMLVQMKKDVESGKQFSDALMRYPKIFSPLYINMVKASELSGGFSKMLDRIAGYLDQQIETVEHGQGRDDLPRHHRHDGDRHDDLPADVRAAALHGDLQGQGSTPCPRRPSCCWRCRNFMVNYWYILLVGAGRRRLGLHPDAPDRLGPRSGSTRSS